MASPGSREPSPGRRLRDSWSRGPVLLPGVFCPLVAKMAERQGYSAVYLSGVSIIYGAPIFVISVAEDIRYIGPLFQRLEVFVHSTMYLLYCASSMYILVASFKQLTALPPEAFIVPSWGINIPHFS